jgi:hypothetical protein
LGFLALGNLPFNCTGRRLHPPGHCPGRVGDFRFGFRRLGHRRRRKSRRWWPIAVR